MKNILAGVLVIVATNAVAADAETEKAAQDAWNKSGCFMALRKTARASAKIDVEFPWIIEPNRVRTFKDGGHIFFGNDIKFQNAFGVYIPTDWVCKVHANGDVYSTMFAHGRVEYVQGDIDNLCGQDCKGK